MTNRLYSLPLLAILALVVRSEAATNGPALQGLGDLDGGGFGSSAEGVSSDGTVVVGRGSGQFGPEAYRWREGQGMLRLGDLPPGTGPFNSAAYGVSADGTRFVGSGAAWYTKVYGTRWDEQQNIESLDALTSSTAPLRTSTAYAANADGSWIVGQSNIDAGGFHAVLWRPGTAIPMRDLGVVLVPPTVIPPTAGAASYQSAAYDISPDNQFIVGQSSAQVITTQQGIVASCVPVLDPSYSGNCQAVVSEIVGFDPDTGDPIFEDAVYPGYASANLTNNYTILFTLTQGFVYTPTGGIQSLDPSPGVDRYSSARAVSGDGNVIVGSTNWQGFTGAAVWNKNGASYTAQGIGDLAGGDELCELLDVSDDGTLAVGYGSTEIPPNPPATLLLQIAQLEALDPPQGSEEYALLQQLIAQRDSYPATPIQRPVIWSPSTGLMRLDTTLLHWGVDLTGWELTEATGISADGDVIVGNGIHDGFAEAWRITGARALFGLTPTTIPLPEVAIETGRVLSFPIEPDEEYQVEVSDNLFSWSPLGPALSTEGIAHASSHHLVLPDELPASFFRVQGGTSNPALSIAEGTVLSFQSQPGFVYTPQHTSDFSSWADGSGSIDTGSELFPHPRTFFFPHEAHPSPVPPSQAFRLNVEFSTP